MHRSRMRDTRHHLRDLPAWGRGLVMHLTTEKEQDAARYQYQYDRLHEGAQALYDVLLEVAGITADSPDEETALLAFIKEHAPRAYPRLEALFPPDEGNLTSPPERKR